ncbi:hypothetical protein CCMA1212_010056 [Trichoderma ghanense]|uniref:Uncharacterized protein n=1 Tax=Trichoderma ghanense TaxID=65468 RepID=A0ABY2GSM8_9HYPO
MTARSTGCKAPSKATSMGTGTGRWARRPRQNGRSKPESVTVDNFQAPEKKRFYHGRVQGVPHKQALRFNAKLSPAPTPVRDSRLMGANWLAPKPGPADAIQQLRAHGGSKVFELAAIRAFALQTDLPWHHSTEQPGAHECTVQGLSGLRAWGGGLR